jgi:hypothetical protein
VENNLAKSDDKEDIDDDDDDDDFDEAEAGENTKSLECSSSLFPSESFSEADGNEDVDEEGLSLSACTD